MKLLILFAFLGLTIGLSAQDFLKCEKFPLKLKKHYAEAEPCIEKLCELVLDAPMRAYSDEVHEARKLILKFAEGTPHHTYELNAGIMAIFKDDNMTLFNLYLCCLVKASLDNDHAAEAIQILASYAKDPNHKVVMNKKMKKFIRNIEDGKFESCLK